MWKEILMKCSRLETRCPWCLQLSMCTSTKQCKKNMVRVQEGNLTNPLEFMQVFFTNISRSHLNKVQTQTAVLLLRSFIYSSYTPSIQQKPKQQSLWADIQHTQETCYCGSSPWSCRKKNPNQKKNNMVKAITLVSPNLSLCHYLVALLLTPRSV